MAADHAADVAAQNPLVPLYRCDIHGDASPLVMEQGVEALCRRHPEMGPCRYERDRCRANGGHVQVADGSEIDAAIEAQYDRRVMRVRLNNDGSAPQ